MAVSEARAAARFALEETRRSVLGLAPSPLEGRSLEEALERELAWANRTGAADVRLVVAGKPSPLRAELAHSLFRIAQEALTNALHHADARSVRIGVVYAPAAVTLLVQDDGAGFDPDEVEQAGALNGIGLRGMAERADLMGGTLEVDSTPGWGTRVRAHLPRSRARAEPLRPRTRLRLLVVDDHEAIRIGIARLLSDAEPSIEVVGQAGSGREALALWRALRPDVVLMDLRMPDGDGVEAIVADPGRGRRGGHRRAHRLRPRRARGRGPARRGARATWARTPPAPSWPAPCWPPPTAAPCSPARRWSASTPTSTAPRRSRPASGRC